MNQRALLTVSIYLSVTMIWFIAHGRAQQTNRRDGSWPVNRISGAQAYSMYKEGTTLIVDAHKRSDYATRHVMGAINIPWDEVDKKKVGLPKVFKIVIYCR